MDVTKSGSIFLLASHEDIHITKNGTDIAVLTAPKIKNNWVDDLTGIIPGTVDDIKRFKAERLAKKYESLD